MKANRAAERDDIERPEVGVRKQNVMRNAHHDRAAVNRFVVDAQRTFGAKCTWRRQRQIHNPLCHLGAHDSDIGIDRHFLRRDPIQQCEARRAAGAVRAKLSA